jgi:hypothetical protein
MIQNKDPPREIFDFSSTLLSVLYRTILSQMVDQGLMAQTSVRVRAEGPKGGQVIPRFAPETLG